MIRSSTSPISSRVDRAFATETVDTGSILGRSNQRPIKVIFIASLLDSHHLRDSLNSPLSVIDKWAGDSLT